MSEGWSEALRVGLSAGMAQARAVAATVRHEVDESTSGPAKLGRAVLEGGENAVGLLRGAVDVSTTLGRIVVGVGVSVARDVMASGVSAAKDVVGPRLAEARGLAESGLGALVDMAMGGRDEDPRSGDSAGGTDLFPPGWDRSDHGAPPDEQPAGTDSLQGAEPDEVRTAPRRGPGAGRGRHPSGAGGEPAPKPTHPRRSVPPGFDDEPGTGAPRSTGTSGPRRRPVGGRPADLAEPGLPAGDEAPSPRDSGGPED